MLCLALGQKLSTIRRGVHGRYPRKLADGERNAFGKFCLHKLRELAHNVAVVIEFDSANLDNLIAQPTALTLLWHRRKLKVQHDLARKVRRIDGQDTRRLFS